jgi:ectoine hydroxylase-related dioxygenase (phytanoyl-CoA dioxygenase family)
MRSSPDSEKIKFYQDNGYAVARRLFSSDECQTLRQHYMTLRERESASDDFGKVDPASSDPLKRYPRMLQMHRRDPLSMKWMIDPRIDQWLTALVGQSPLAVQTMIYFKPPGARGQALHQDQFYLRAKPGTCHAAWLALDDCDEDNGCMTIVPGSHAWPVLCATAADTSVSFTSVTVPLPPDAKAEPVVMKAGDVLFFNGQLVHGSGPNSTTDRFRRALIGHYIEGDARQVGRYYHPIFRMDGSEVELGVSVGSTRCGVWVERDGETVLDEREAKSMEVVHD